MYSKGFFFLFSLCNICIVFITLGGLSMRLKYGPTSCQLLNMLYLSQTIRTKLIETRTVPYWNAYPNLTFFEVMGLSPSNNSFVLYCSSLRKETYSIGSTSRIILDFSINYFQVIGLQ